MICIQIERPIYKTFFFFFEKTHLQDLDGWMGPLPNVWLKLKALNKLLKHNAKDGWMGPLPINKSYAFGTKHNKIIYHY